GCGLRHPRSGTALACLCPCRSGGSREPLIFAAARKSSRLPPLLQRRMAMSDTGRRGRSPDLQLAGRITLAMRERHRHAVRAQHGGELTLARLVMGEAALQAVVVGVVVAAIGFARFGTARAPCARR